MKKLIFLALLSFVMLSAANAQDQLKLLNVQETTEGIGVYPCGNNRHEALVQFVTQEPFDLSFESTHDKELNIQIDSVAGKKTYSIVFITQAPGQNYSARRITIHVPGFQDFRLPLNLQDKQKFEYTISDPYSKLRSPFFVYFENAQQAFNEGSFQTAKDNYEKCRYCPEYAQDSSRINGHINICDSMLHWNDQAIRAEHFHNYRDEANYYSRMLSYNTSSDLRNSLFKAQQDFMSDCQASMHIATMYLNNGELDKAQQKLDEIIENGCSVYAEDATKMMQDVRKARIHRKEHPRALMFAWGPNSMMGFTRGGFYESRSHAWYFTIMTNRDMIDLISMKAHPEGTVTGIPQGATSASDIDQSNLGFEYSDLTKDKNNQGNYYPKDKKLDYEGLFTIGCDWHIYKPLFIHFGVGYHGGGFSTFDSQSFYEACDVNTDDQIVLSDQNTWTDKFRYEGSKVNWFNGAAPEIGFALKYWRLIIKGTFQYTYWINNEHYEDFLKENSKSFYFGAGFCW